MKIHINGAEKVFEGPLKLSEIVSKFCKEPRCIVTAVNGDLVLRGDWERTVVKQGDNVDLVTPVGGG